MLPLTGGLSAIPQRLCEVLQRSIWFPPGGAACPGGGGGGLGVGVGVGGGARWSTAAALIAGVRHAVATPGTMRYQVGGHMLIPADLVPHEGSDNTRDPKEGGQVNSARKEAMAIDRQVV
jgi:hypothetical protein